MVRLPSTLAELMGCRQSVRAGIPSDSDDARRVPMGNVRICYWFGESGRGTILV
jgi:hypothetical protein